MNGRFEIHIIGTGGGYGESIVVNLGNDEWIVIDSCINPNTKESLPLNFLNEAKIDLSKVVLVICTHWHDDHIKGLSMLLEACPNAVFSFGQVLDKEKFFDFIGVDNIKVKSTESNCSTIEFNKCIDIISKRLGQSRFATIDKCLFSSKYKGIDLLVYSLSPSQKSMENFNAELALLIDEASKSNVKIINQTPNDKSVVILLRIGENNILLGADLEVKNESNIGWLDIIENSQIVKQHGKSTYFKIPHHGSENGYHDSIWELLLIEKPISSITIWRRSIQLPTPEMVELYFNKSDKLYMTTSLGLSKKPKSRSNKVTAIIKQNCKAIEEVKYVYGVISSYFNLDEEINWRTDLAGSAIEVKK